MDKPRLSDVQNLTISCLIVFNILIVGITLNIIFLCFGTIQSRPHWYFLDEGNKSIYYLPPFLELNSKVEIPLQTGVSSHYRYLRLQMLYDALPRRAFRCISL